MTLRSVFSAALLSTALGGAAPAGAEPPRSYTIEVTAPDAKAGQAARFAVRVVPVKGMHMNLEYPTSATVQSPQGVEGPAGKQKPTQIDKAAARFELAFKAAAPGPKQFLSTVSFAVCNDDNTLCEPHREKVPVTVNVK